ncbi:MAG: AbrB/MazE/SpoVT family DNA-binding domain-containing protein [Casimicrobiaceae bacterium]
MKAVVAERGQVTIPKTLRSKLGIQPGSVLEFEAKDGCLIAKKRVDDPVDAATGILGHGGNSDAYLEKLRG